ISLVNNDQVCVWINQADSHGIACVRTADGSLLWEHIICTLSCDLYTQVVEMTNIFYISEQQGGAVGDEKTTITLHALRMSDGQQLWRYQIDSNSSVITEGTSVYINFPQDRSVVALNAATGDVRWRYKMQA
ncbi:MAG TPA: PQQ-binding-like beta-propeller repeat protein, partial [Ktedonobacteraceae bacterium]|nr:PQQ-binding-like beta-propeller repeat protein [Ktedonobacteraceae bacterium]